MTGDFFDALFRLRPGPGGSRAGFRGLGTPSPDRGFPIQILLQIDESGTGQGNHCFLIKILLKIAESGTGPENPCFFNSNLIKNR